MIVELNNDEQDGFYEGMLIPKDSIIIVAILGIDCIIQKHCAEITTPLILIVTSITPSLQMTMLEFLTEATEITGDMAPAEGYALVLIWQSGICGALLLSFFGLSISMSHETQKQGK